ncbi:MAG: DUF481 domain-containing protein [Bacteroidota bacterium]
MMGRRFLCLLVIILSSQTLDAQNTSDSLAFNSTFRLGGQRKAGVFSQTVVNGSISLGAQYSRWSFDHNTTYTYSIVNGNRLSDDWTVVSKLRYSFSQQRRLSLTAIHVYKNNLLYRLDNSHRAMLGISLAPFKDNQRFWLFVGSGYEVSRYSGEVFDQSPLVDASRTFGFASLYVENKHQLIKNRLYFQYKLFYIQSVEESRDFTIWIIPSLSFALNESIRFSLNYDYRYRNVHLADIPGFNELLTFNISASFSY